MPEGLGKREKGVPSLPVRTSFGFVVTYVWIHGIIVRIDGTAVCGIEPYLATRPGRRPPPPRVISVF